MSLARSGLNMKVTHPIKVNVTGYYHILVGNMLLPTMVAYPDKKQDYGDGPRVADPGADL